ncbi:MAG: hypothetical protein LUG49_06610 [Oscillospiraceae bacterium]|nr:hypothetical protein [Oscillospiraceae bacterium]
MKRIILILTCLAILLTLAGCAGVNVSDFVETNYSDSHETEAKEPVSEVSNPLLNADLSACTVTVTRRFDVQALNDPIALEGDELAEFVSTLESAEIAEEPVELEDFDADSIVTHYTVTLSDGIELELSYYESSHWNYSTAVYDPDYYLVINGELFTIDEESINTLESYYRNIYSEDYTLHEICYAEYKHDSGEWSDVCYSQARNWILGNAYLIANPGDYSYYSGDWSERREREKAEMDEILSTIDDILPYVLRDDGTVNEDRFVNDGEMVPYKIDEPINPLLEADFEDCTVYVERNKAGDPQIEMDEETKSEFLELLMTLEMDETPTVDDNMYAGGEYLPRYTIAFSDGSEYLIYFMAVSVPVGNNIYGDARYIVIGDYKYCIPYEDFSSGLVDEIESYYDTQYLIDSSLDEFCEIMSSCANVAPGTAGSSLRSVSAAGSLLDWAEFRRYILTENAVTALLEEWQENSEDFDWQFECLKESWESVAGSIEEIISDPTDESLSGLLDDSGYTLQYDEYDEEIAEMIISAIENFIAQ